MNKNLRTTLDRLNVADISTPELILRPQSGGVDVELILFDRKDRLVRLCGNSIMGVSTALTGADLSLKVDTTALKAFNNFVAYSPNILKAKELNRFMVNVDTSVTNIREIKMRAEWIFMEFHTGGRHMGMKVGTSGYVQLYDLSQAKSKRIPLTQFSRSHGTTSAKTQEVAEELMKYLDFLRK